MDIKIVFDIYNEEIHAYQNIQIQFITNCKHFANDGENSYQIKITFALCEMPHLYDQFSTGLEIQLKRRPYSIDNTG